MSFLNEEFANAIIDGDLSKILEMVPKGYSLSFYFRGEFKIKSKQKKNTLPFINNPTPLVLCILCEQDQILETFLTQYNCDLFQYVGEWTPIHYACCTKSYECLAIMLKIRKFCEKIDIPIKEAIDAPNDRRITALHVAVTNRRYNQVILLTQELIKCNATSQIELLSGHVVMASDIDRKSLSGNTPLHIAVHLNDPEMCKILLSADPDLSIVNDEDLTPLEMAKQLNREEIVSILKNKLDYSFDMLVYKYFTEEFVKKYNIEVDVPQEYKYEQQIKDLTSQVIDLSAQLTELEKS